MNQFQERTVIKFSHEETEALLKLYDYIEHDEELTEAEKSAKEKLKKIYARQILSHEKRMRDFAMERRSDARTEDNNS